MASISNQPMPDIQSTTPTQAPPSSSDNPEVAWWCKLLTRAVATLGGVGNYYNLIQVTQLYL